MTKQHKALTDGRWQDLSLMEQLANIGSEVLRAIKWRKKGNTHYSTLAFHRALELLDLTIRIPSLGLHRRRELTRLRSALVDDFAGTNEFRSSDILWERMFTAYTYAARRQY